MYRHVLFVVQIGLDHVFNHFEAVVVVKALVQNISADQSQIFGIGIIVKDTKCKQWLGTGRIHLEIFQVGHEKVIRSLELGNHHEETVIAKDGLDKEWTVMQQDRERFKKSEPATEVQSVK